MFKRGDRVLVDCAHPFKTVVIRYVSEMTRYGSDEHLPGWYQTRKGTVHESQLVAL